MKKELSPGAFVGIIALVLVLLVGAAVMFFRRTAASSGATTTDPETGMTTTAAGGLVRSHPNETLEQRRARIMQERGPGRVRGQ